MLKRSSLHIPNAMLSCLVTLLLTSPVGAQLSGFLPVANASAVATDSKREQPLPGKLIKGKPLGLFYMQKYWIATRSLEKSCWYFTADDRVYQDLASGFSEQDLKAHTGPHGRFSLSNGQMTVVWSDGTTESSEMELEKTGFSWNTGSYLAVEPFKNAQIEGTYAGGSSMSFAGASTMIAKTLQLNKGGTFALSGVTSIRTDSAAQTDPKESEFFAGGGSDTSGRWQLDGFYLILTNSSGKSIQHVVFPFDDAETPVYPDRLFLGGIMYKKQ